MRRLFVVPLVVLVLLTGCRRPVQPPTAPAPPPGAPKPTAAPPKPAPPAGPPLAMAAPDEISTPGIWFAFDPDFIRNRYRSADLAFGTFTLSEEWRASAIHDENCSGEDREVHVGGYEDHLGLDDSEIPFSSPVHSERIAWGTVIEPPNVTTAQGNELEKLEGTTATFEGYLRVWNEGHFDDETDRRPGGFSNPNHILELHPAWRMTTPKGVTRTYSLRAMDDYSGYGLSKLKTILKGFASRTWPTMYQDGEALYIHLPRGQPYESNFYQLPVVIRSVTTIDEGTVMDADVCDRVDCSGKTFLYKGLRLVSVPSTEEGTPYIVDEKAELLGIFSVNLRRALDLAPTSETEAGAKVLTEALEFFVFGRAKNQAVRNSQCQPEKTP
jgi:hypothetical protein